MVLLHLLNQLAKETGWRLTVAHLNHRLRGQSSQADERLAGRTARILGLPFVSERADVRSLARTQHVSIEMAARQARHEFLARTARRLGLGVIALAHHADDQLELFFLRLLRGTGAKGLTGMKWRSPSPVTPTVQLVRPLLNLQKEVLRRYALQHKIKFREDASNACLDFLRNRIRSELLPLLKKQYQPALDCAINRTVDLVGGESDFVELAADKWLAGLAAPAGRAKRGSQAGYESATERFEDLHVAVQRRVIHAQLLKLGIVPDYELVEKLRSKPAARVTVARMERGAAIEAETAVQFPRKLRGCVLREKTGLLRLVEPPVALAPFAPDVVKCELTNRGGGAEFGGLRLRWKFTRGNHGFKPKLLPGKELFDAEKIGGQIILRHWRPGDRFQPIGMACHVKLQDLFTNQRIPAATRRKLVLATTAGGEVFWAEGLRISERFKLTSQTIRRLHWAWERL